MSTPSVIDAAKAVLEAGIPSAKCAAAHELSISWKRGELHIVAAKTELSNIPGRPDAPDLVNPRDLKRRRLGTVEGRISLMHAIAHIEFNAINLAADIVARFALNPLISDTNRAAFIDDWVQVCDDEARHFSLVEARLKSLGSSYGALPAHDGLWEAAISTKDDLAARLVIAPMVLEARGLDVTPKMIENLRNVSDHESADILTIILNDEVAHVAAGARWFQYVCEKEKRQETPYFKALLETHFKGSLKPPFNVDARDQAGIPRAFYQKEHPKN